jgi:hypothetical protein
MGQPLRVEAETRIERIQLVAANVACGSISTFMIVGRRFRSTPTNRHSQSRAACRGIPATASSAGDPPPERNPASLPPPIQQENHSIGEVFTQPTGPLTDWTSIKNWLRSRWSSWGENGNAATSVPRACRRRGSLADCLACAIKATGDRPSVQRNAAKRAVSRRRPATRAKGSRLRRRRQRRI